MLGLHRRTTGDARWDQPFDIVRDGEHTFSWSHSTIAEHLADQWSGRPEGCHCENTKVWPLCLSAAGLGLKLHDLLFGGDLHDVFRSWWANTARTAYLGFEGDRPSDMPTFYFDPIVDVHHRLPAFAASTFVAHYLAAQVPADARALWDSARAQMGLLDPPFNPSLDPRGTALYLFLAKEWDIPDLAAAVSRDADARLEPTWDLDAGEFTWGLGLGEPHPRGQWNAAMATGEANSVGGWWRLANDYDAGRFDEPTVVDVDFPTVVPTQAWWDRSQQKLVISLAPRNETDTGLPTSFRVTNREDPARWTATPTNGVPVTSAPAGDALQIDTTVAHLSLVVERD